MTTSYAGLPSTDDVTLPGERVLRVVSMLMRAWLRRRYDVHVHEPDKVPRRGPVLLACNHLGWLDGPLLAVTPRPAHALSKDELFRGRTGALLRATGQVPLARRHVDPRAVRTSLAVLRAGGVVVIFPEGERGLGDVRHAKRGLAYLAMATGAPVVPVAVLGTRTGTESIEARPPRGRRLDVVFGEPVQVPTQDWPRRRSEVVATTRMLQEHLAAHVRAAVVRTGQSLPGPAPDQRRPDRDTVSRGEPAVEEAS